MKRLEPVSCQHNKSSHMQECSFLLIDLKNNRQPKKPHGHASKYFAIQCNIQMGLPKQSGKSLILCIDSSSRKIVMTSAHLPEAQWQRKRKGGHCWKGNQTTSPSWYSLIHDTKLIVTTIKANYVQRALCKEGCQGTATGIQRVRNLLSQVSSKSAEMGGDETHRSNHIWFTHEDHVWNPDTAAGGGFESSQTTKVTAVIRIHTRSAEVCSNRLTNRKRRRNTDLRRLGFWIFT